MDETLSMVDPDWDLLGATASIGPSRTGLPTVIQVYSQGDGEWAQHGPFVKVTGGVNGLSEGALSYTVNRTDPVVKDGDPDAFEAWKLHKVEQFIRLNYDDLIALWNNEIAHDEFIDRMERVK